MGQHRRRALLDYLDNFGNQVEALDLAMQMHSRLVRLQAAVHMELVGSWQPFAEKDCSVVHLMLH